MAPNVSDKLRPLFPQMVCPTCRTRIKFDIKLRLFCKYSIRSMRYWIQRYDPQSRRYPYSWAETDMCHQLNMNYPGRVVVSRHKPPSKLPTEDHPCAGYIDKLRERRSWDAQLMPYVMIYSTIHIFIISLFTFTTL